MFRYRAYVRDQKPDRSTDLVRWRSFIAVHRTGSVTAAARTLGLSQPSVTAHVQELEKSLGEKLFVRRARGVEPTPRADELASRLAGPLDAAVAAVKSVQRRTDAAERVVRIGGPAEFLAEVAVPALAPLVAQGLRLDVTPGLPDELLEMVRSGRLDLVVASTRPSGRRLVTAALTDETFMLVASPALAPAPGLLAAEGHAALQDVPLLAYARDVPILRRYWRHVFGVRLTAEPRLVAPDLRALKAAAVAGAGVTVLPTYLCARELADGSLVQLVETDDPPINTIYVVRRPGSPASRQVYQVHRALVAAVQGW